ncbi:galanin receptor type 1-like [Saccoglossus kowalevskii]
MIVPNTSALVRSDFDNVSVMNYSLEMYNSTNGGFEMPISELGTAFLFSFYALAIFLSLSGNITVITVLHGSKAKNGVNAYLVNLSIADICMAVFCTPFTSVNVVLQNWIFGDFMCTFVHFMQQVSVMVSIFTLVVISVNRYSAVVKPLNTHRGHPRKRVVITLIWTVAMLVSLFQLIVVLKMVFVVILAFFICWTPLHCLRLIVVFVPSILSIGGYGYTVVRLFLAFHWLAVSHSFINPFIYTFLSKSFRKLLPFTDTTYSHAMSIFGAIIILSV